MLYYVRAVVNGRPCTALVEARSTTQAIHRCRAFLTHIGKDPPPATGFLARLCLDSKAHPERN